MLIILSNILEHGKIETAFPLHSLQVPEKYPKDLEPEAQEYVCMCDREREMNLPLYCDRLRYAVSNPGL